MHFIDSLVRMPVSAEPRFVLNGFLDCVKPSLGAVVHCTLINAAKKHLCWLIFEWTGMGQNNVEVFLANLLLNIGFAGVDPGVDDSGKHSTKSVPTTKRGSPHLRKTLYQIICTYLKKSPEDEPVYQFLDKKRTEGKPYFVYMTAAQNKFLRIYYARVKECLEAFDAQQNSTHS